MGKLTRRFGAAFAAAAIAITGLAGAANAATSPYPDHDDYKWYGPDKLVTVDGNDKVYRAAGRDRVETAIQLMCHATDHAWKGVIIARSDDFADALTSGPLADVTNYALLVMPSGQVDARVMSAIANGCNSYRNEDTNIQNVVLIGGTGVWSEGQRAAIETATGKDVWRVSGIDRYDTSIAIARAVSLYTCLGDLANWWGTVYPPAFHTCKWNMNAYVATGQDFPDALAAGAAAAANDGVVLLTDGSKMDQRDRTVKFLDNELEWMPANFFNHVEIHSVGGWADTALRSADIRVDFKHVGKDRYETAVLLARAYSQAEKSYTIASGENYPDGVVAGAFAANHDGPLLLSNNASLTPVTRDYLRAESDLHARVMVVGGDGTITRQVSQDVWDALHY